MSRESKEYILAAFCDACTTLTPDEAMAQVAGITGNDVETIREVVEEEAAV